MKHLNQSGSKSFRLILALMALLFIVGPGICPADMDTVKLSNEVTWVRASNEYRFCAQQAYDNAQNRLINLSKGHKPGTWCVVFDMDETLVSNVEYQVMVEAAGEKYSDASWDRWCKMEDATAIPGALEFCHLVKKLGGRVVVITNRHGNNRPETVRNLDKLKIPYDFCSLQEGPYAKDGVKEKRRQDLEKGILEIPGKKVPPLKILMLAGDQSHDFYDPAKMTADQAIKHFKDRFIVIPNPMYGDWIKSPRGKVTRSKAFEDQELKGTVGEIISVELTSNPSTGYRWELASPLNDKVLQLVDYSYVAPENPVPGKAGVEKWRFKAVGPGKAVVEMKYARPWEKNDKDQAKKTIIINIE